MKIQDPQLMGRIAYYDGKACYLLGIILQNVDKNHQVCNVNVSRWAKMCNVREDVIYRKLSLLESTGFIMPDFGGNGWAVINVNPCLTHRKRQTLKTTRFDPEPLTERDIDFYFETFHRE